MNLITTIEESRAWHPEHPGWATDILPFYSELQKSIPDGGTFVEIGVFLGRSLRYMQEIRPDLELWAVDPWLDGESQGYTGPGEHAEYIRVRGGLFRAFLASMPSLDRVHVHRDGFGTLSGIIPHAVFIDGAHDYESVVGDISNALMLCSPIICGHDYNPEWDKQRDGPDDGRAGVITAVHDLLGTPKLMGTCWRVDR